MLSSYLFSTVAVLRPSLRMRVVYVSILASLLLSFLRIQDVDAASREAGLRVGLQGTWRSFGDSLRSARPHLIAAAVARCASITAGYPLDTIKTRLHLGRAAAATSIPDMYRGLGSSLAGQVPYGMLTFGTYELYKTALLERFPQLPRAITFCLAAVLGDMTGSLWLVPSEVVKVQMQGGLHATVGQAAMSIFTKSGVGGFYQGFSGQVGRDVPFRAIQLTSYELLRTLFRTSRRRQHTGVATERGDDSGGVLVGRARGGAATAAAGGDGEHAALSSGDAALLGGLAGAISATFTCPLDVVRTRLMVGGGGGAAETWAAAIKAGGLFSGLGTRVFYIGTSSAVFFVVYEAIKIRLGVVAASSPPAAIIKAKRQQ
ncbi:unnamed protein product [Ectocarpus sp. 12 AP-2014]